MTTAIKMHERKMKCFAVLEDKLAELSKHRRERALNDWILFEREGMHDEVNRLRAQDGLGPVPLAEVEKAERMSVGHSDYHHKFPLYCAELVVGET